jgi:hypothetical protein
MSATLAVDSVESRGERVAQVTCLDCRGSVQLDVRPKRLIRLVERLADYHECPDDLAG